VGNLRKVDLAKIKQLRKKFGYSLEEMARILGYESVNGYYYLEIGRGKFSAEMLAKVADIFSISIEELFFVENVTELAT
jgi:transcriptional regulator with XRE-family HTH domain